MLAPITFVLADGRQVNPMQVAPWAQEPEKVDGVLKRLRGDWPCIPFGMSPESSEGWPEDWAKPDGPARALGRAARLWLEQRLGVARERRQQPADGDRLSRRTIR